MVAAGPEVGGVDGPLPGGPNRGGSPKWLPIVEPAVGVLGGAGGRDAGGDDPPAGGGGGGLGGAVGPAEGGVGGDSSSRSSFPFLFALPALSFLCLFALAVLFFLPLLFLLHVFSRAQVHYHYQKCFVPQYSSGRALNAVPIV